MANAVADATCSKDQVESHDSDQIRGQVKLFVWLVRDCLSTLYNVG